MRHIAVIVLLVFIASFVSAQDDGIPNNCPFARGVFYHQNWFIRAEGAGTTVTDWASGVTLRTLSQRAGTDIIVGRWSPECQYVSVAYGTPDETGTVIYTSVVYDVVNGGEVAIFEGARRIPYPLTWDTNSTRLLVETRFGAYIHYLTGGDVWLTSEADGNSRAFRAGSVRWDYTANQLIGVLTIAPFGSAAYDMSSGALVGLTDQFNRPQDVTTASYLVQGREGGEQYPCVTSDYYVSVYLTRVFERRGATRSFIQNTRIVVQPETRDVQLVDSGTNELIQTLPINVGAAESSYAFDAWWLPGCRSLAVISGWNETRGYGLKIYDAATGQQQLSLSGYFAYQINVDPSGRYVAYTTRLGGFFTDLTTGTTHRVFETVKRDIRGGNPTWTYDTVLWDLANGTVEFGVQFNPYCWHSSCGINEYRMFSLTTGDLLSVTDGSRVQETADAFALVRARVESPYGCRFRVEYNKAGQFIFLRDPITPDVLVVIDDGLALDGFGFAGLSDDCRYVTVNLTQGSEVRKVIYDLVSLEPTMSTVTGMAAH